MSFEAGSLERQYAFLDECPESLLGQIVTLPISSLEDRVTGVLAWREALLAGRLPPEDVWPPDVVAAPVRAALKAMDFVRFLRGESDLVDALLADVLVAFSQQAETLRSEVAERIRELELLERQRVDEASGRRAGAASTLGEETRQRLRAQAEREAQAVARPADPGLLALWGERVRAWAAISDVFGDLGQMLGRGWDLAQGVLRNTGWLEVERLRKLVEQVPQLRAIIQALGRLQTSTQEESVAEKILVPVRRVEEERREVPTPLVPHETRGIERSGEIARMLPAEASMLGHPKLRLLWHARRAERALLTYRVEGVETERVLTEVETHEEREGQRPRPERGPILSVIDTSGSMHGLPEQVAKALVLETVRTAHAEKRRCYLYAYSGPNQVLEHELDLSPEGIGRLLVFLSRSFGGGTDIGAMSRVVERLGQEDWKKADVILVTDGEWVAPAAIVNGVRSAREQGTRFHGVQIGNRGKTGLHDLCDPVHVFTDWSTAGGW